MPYLNEVLTQALRLSVRERAALAEQVLASLEEVSPQEADRIWAEEAQRRLDELRAGRACATPAEEVHKKAEGLLR